MGLAILLEVLLLFLLLSLGSAKRPGRGSENVTVVNVQAREVAKEKPAPESTQRDQQEESAVEPRNERRPKPEEQLPLQPKAASERLLPQQPVPPIVPPLATSIVDLPFEASIKPGRKEASPSAKPAYGPQATDRSSYSDTARVGTAPNGEPLYAAAWYREPEEDELRGYLSTATGTGWGLIACRTAPDFRVEDCVSLDEEPRGSQINRAILAAAWQFKVRPPRLGGVSQVGSWVRIRIDYSINRR
jgi:protein TonB